MSVRLRNSFGHSAFSPGAGGARSAVVRGIVAGAFLGVAAVAQSPIEQLTIGPLKLQKSVFMDLTASTNVDGISKETARLQGVEQEDVFLSYGFNFGISGRVYPDIDLNFSSDMMKERHFVRTDLNDDGEIPILGEATFDFTRTRGHLRYGFSLLHSAETEEEKQKVFVPSARRLQSVREVEQITDVGGTLGWTYERLSLLNTYHYIRTRFNEEFADGDENEENYSFDAKYELNRIFSLSFTHLLEKTEQIGLPDLPEFGWEKTTTLLLNSKLLQRPSLTYSVGFESEDQGAVEGEWEPIHNVVLSDYRNIGSNVKLSADATYSYEADPEAEDISFIYNVSLSHQMPYSITQTLQFTREPAETFGSTADSDQTTYSYSLNKDRLFLVNLSASFTAEREETKPVFSDGSTGPSEISDELIFDLNWQGPKALSRWLSLRRDYQYIYTDSTLEGTFDEHRLTLGVEVTL